MHLYALHVRPTSLRLYVIEGVGGRQALHMAIDKLDWDCIKKLLDYGASPNALDDDGVTPFHLSCHKNSLSLLGLLLQKGADVSIVDKAGCGPIQHAVQAGNVYVHTCTHARMRANTHTMHV